MKDNLGKKGENKFLSFAKAKNYDVKDVSNDPEYWDKDIDYIISNGLNSLGIECKEDDVMHRTGNLFLEHTSYSGHRADKRGWFRYTEADWLFYYDSVNQIAYFILITELRNLVELSNYRSRLTPGVRMAYDSEGYLCPLSDVLMLKNTKMIKI